MASTTSETTPLPPSTTAPTTTTSQATTTTTPTTSEATSPTTTTEGTTTSSETTTTTSGTTPTGTTTSTSSQTTSSQTDTTSSSTTGTPVVTTTSSTRLSTSTSINNGVTQTVVVTDSNTSPSASQSAISDSKSGDGGFFHNTGAVAGVFTVVGLIALVLVVALATNAIRRRRAKKFDDEVAAAAAEASASPRYPFDDYDDRAPGGGYGSYSDPESHGTMSQVPLTQHGESYNMSEFNGGYGATYGGSSTAAAAVSAGAAGIGAANSVARRNTTPHATYADVGGAGIAGFGATQNSVSTGHGQVQPYNAFAGPLNTIPADPYDPYTAGTLGIKRQGSRGANDLLDAAGVGAAAAGAGAAAGALNRGPSQGAGQTLDRSRSQTTQRTLSPDNSNQSASGKTQESYAAHYQPGFKPDEYQYHPSTGAVPPGPPPAPAADLPNPFGRDGSDEDAYGADSFMPGGRQSPSHDDGRLSIRDEEDYGRAGRTLKVANE